MAARKRTIKSRSMAKKRGVASRRKSSAKVMNFFVPLFFVIAILFCLSLLTFMGYRTVTASAFFDVKSIDIRGISRLPKDDIERIVSRQAEKSGVWNADLKQIREDIEKLTLVKSAVVSRILPDGLRIAINERTPRAVVRIGGGDYWADEDAVIIGAVQRTDAHPPFYMQGWDENKTDKAVRDNRERVKVYLKMLDEWRNFELAKRVNMVDLSDLQEPQAMVQDSGEMVTIILPRDNLGKRLQTGLERIAGRGKDVKSIDLSNQKEVLGFRVN